MEQLTYWSHLTAAGDDEDDGETTSSIRRLIDAIVTSEHLQRQWNFDDVRCQLLSNDIREEPVVQVGQKVKLLNFFIHQITSGSKEKNNKNLTSLTNDGINNINNAEQTSHSAMW